MGYDAFAIIADDLNLSPDQLIITARQNPEGLRKDLEQSGLAHLPFILEEDLRVHGSRAPILVRGMNLMNNIDAVFRILQLEQSFIAPPSIKPDTRINNYLKNKIRADLERISRKVRTSKKFGTFFLRAEKNQDVRFAINNLTAALHKYLSSPEVIAALWSSLRDVGRSSLMEDCVNASLLAMIAAAAYFQTDQIAEKTLRRTQITNIGLSALFQDLSILANGGRDPDSGTGHAASSARLVRQIDLPEECIIAIAHHHRITDERGRPVLESGSPGLCERILVCITYFLRCVLKKYFDLSIDEAIYIMNYYARRLYFDQKVVMALGQMGVGGLKSRIMSMAADLVQKCDRQYEPHLWDVNAAVPNRIICGRNCCEHLGEERVYLFRQVVFETPEHRFIIAAGQYRHCRKLTEKLGHGIVNLYRSGQ